MAPAAVVPALDPAEDHLAGGVPSSERRRCTSSVLKLAIADSQAALSYAQPRRPMEARRPDSASVRPNTVEAYWLPRSEWWIAPAGGRREVAAIPSASTTSAASSESRIDQPTIRRLKASTTRAT